MGQGAARWAPYLACAGRLARILQSVFTPLADCSPNRFGRAKELKEVADTFDYTGWNLTFRDEFNAFNPWDGAAGTWQTQYYWGRTKGNEGQIYVDKTVTKWDGTPMNLDPFAQGNGTLTIHANPTDPAQYNDLGKPYTSGMLSTFPTFSQTYGYFEMRAEVPAGKGLWPAFWMLPADKSWPPELDIMEVLGKDSYTTYGTAHSNATGTHTFEGVHATGADLSAGFHTYGMEWNSQTVTWYLDGQKIGSVATPADLNKPMYMIVNLAVGADWPGQPDGTTKFPADFTIDYVRAYQKGTDTAVVPQPVDSPTPTKTLSGTDHSDTIQGGSASELIDGKGGADTMKGGYGGDTYVVSQSGDTVVEYSNQGVDTVRSSLSYTLPSMVENLVLTGSADLVGKGTSWHNNIVGNDGNNTLYGMAGNDRLTGGKGADILWGGDGKDTFVMRAVNEAGDVIKDYTPGQDQIDVKQLLTSIGSSSTNPVADGLIAMVQVGKNTAVMLNQPGHAAVKLMTVENTDAHHVALTSDHWA